ncbi:MAG: TIGR02391 family protein [Candidatus Bathyarchaeia archaeon]
MPLVETAFHQDKGKLIFGDSDSERQATFQIFRSAFLMLRNPPAHRYLKDFAGTEIVEIVLFVDFLLKVISKSSDRAT